MFNLDRWKGVPTIGGGCGCPQTNEKAPNCMHHQHAVGSYFTMRRAESRSHNEKQVKRNAKKAKRDTTRFARA